MNGKSSNGMSRKFIAVVCSVAIVVGAATVVSFATTGQDPISAISDVFVVTAGVTAGSDGEAYDNLMVRETDGVREYSTDGGKTWQVTDKDVVETEDGVKVEFNHEAAEGIARGAAEGAGSVMTMTDDSGKTKVSVDNGDTWEDITGKDGEITLQDGTKITIQQMADGTGVTVSGEASGK